MTRSQSLKIAVSFLIYPPGLPNFASLYQTVTVGDMPALQRFLISCRNLEGLHLVDTGDETFMTLEERLPAIKTLSMSDYDWHDQNLRSNIDQIWDFSKLEHLCLKTGAAWTLASFFDHPDKFQNLESFRCEHTLPGRSPPFVTARMAEDMCLFLAELPRLAKLELHGFDPSILMPHFMKIGQHLRSLKLLTDENQEISVADFLVL